MPMSKAKTKKETENKALDTHALKTRILTVDIFFLLTAFHSALQHFWPTSSLYKWSTIPLSVIEVVLFLLIVFKIESLFLPTDNPDKGLKLVSGIESAAWVLWVMGGLTGWMNMPKTVGLVLFFVFCGLLSVYLVCQVICLRHID
jgi:hypothetical protein